MEGGGSGGKGDLRRPGVERREQHHQKPFLPLDIVLEIAARTDPATLVRCAATCRDARRRVADDKSFHRRLRLRHAADGRFVSSLLRDHLVVLDRHNGSLMTGVEVHLVEATAAAGPEASSRRLSAAEGFPPHPDGGKSILWHKPLAWRDGLFLVRTSDRPQGRRDELRVCDPATGRSRTLPPEPTFHGDTERRRSQSWWAAKSPEKSWQPYVLLGGNNGEVGGGGIIGRPFQVLKANLVMSEHHRYLETQTLSSERGTWGTYAKLRAPHFHGRALLKLGRGMPMPLVIGGVVHWLCLTDAASYVLRLNIRTTPAQVTVTTLPTSFPRPNNVVDYLLATATAGGSLMVLVADMEKISAWVQTATKTTTAKWKPRPEVVVEYEAFRQFRNISSSGSFQVRLLWFAERSGFVLVYVGFGYGFFLLDLRSKKIVGWFSGRGLGSPFYSIFAPYEMDLSSWVPTFTSQF